VHLELRGQSVCKAEVQEEEEEIGDAEKAADFNCAKRLTVKTLS